MYIDYADHLVSVGGYISALKINKFLELVTIFCSEGMQYNLMLQFPCWLMPHCIYQLSQHKTTGTRFDLWNSWYFKRLCVFHVMNFFVRNLQPSTGSACLPFGNYPWCICGKQYWSIIADIWFSCSFLGMLPTWINQYLHFCHQ